jgi:hypothetical protein
VWHVTEYERCLVVPTLRQWLGGEPPPEDAWRDDGRARARAGKALRPAREEGLLRLILRAFVVLGRAQAWHCGDASAAASFRGHGRR